MLTFFLTIIAGIIALSLISSLILGIIAIRKKDRENQEYRENGRRSNGTIGKRNKQGDISIYASVYVQGLQ